MTAKSKQRRMFGRRTWLNRDVSLRAALSGHVTLDFSPGKPDGRAEWQREDRFDVSAELVISDCSRTVALDFDVYSASPGDSCEVMRTKIATLRRFVDDFAAKYEDALDRIELTQP